MARKHVRSVSWWRLRMSAVLSAVLSAGKRSWQRRWRSCCAGPRKWMTRRTDSMARTGAGTSCRRSWPFGKVGYRRYGRPWRRWKPRRRRSRPRLKVGSIRERRKTKHSATSPMPTPTSCRRRGSGFRPGLQLSGGGGQREPGDCGSARATNQTSDQQQAAAMVADHRQHRCGPAGSIRRRWLLLGQGS